MHTLIARRVLAVGALAALLVAGTPALAKSVSYVADLKGASEVPPTDSKGTGKVNATSDAASKKRTWTITYSGLTGDAVAAHFHGPAGPGSVRRTSPVWLQSQPERQTRADQKLDGLSIPRTATLIRARDAAAPGQLRWQTTAGS